MHEDPDKWYDDLLDREHHPDIDEPAGGIVGDLRDEALGRAKDKTADFAKDKVKDAGKDLAKKAGKEAAKEGAKAGAQAGAETAAGAVAGGGGATAAGAGIAATTGAETAGIGVAVGAAVALLGNKTFRKILYVLVPLGALIAVFLVVAMVILAPVVILKAIDESPFGKALHFANEVRGTAVSVATFGPRLAAQGIEKGKDLASDAVDFADDHLPDVDLPGGFHIGDTTTPHDPNSPQVLGAQTISKDSRLFKLSVAMNDKGFFKDLKQKYGINIVTTDTQQFDIYLDKKKIHHSNSVTDALAFFNSDQRLQERLMYVMDDIHLYDYSKRVTFAEKGMSDYQSSRLFIPNADKAKSDTDVVNVKKSTIDTVNSPFFAQASTALKCSEDCGTWVPSTVQGDQGTVTGEISDKTGFLPKNTLFSVMNTRVTKDNSLSDEQIIQWFNYVRELRKAANGNSEEFDKGILETRKQQAGRLWFNWGTQVDQFKAGKLTTKSANALFKSLKNIGGSQAFHQLNGQTGGKGFQEYEKINENQGNVAKVIYNKWLDKNGEDAATINSLAGFPTFLGFDNVANNLLLAQFHSDAGVRKALNSAFRLGSEAMIPKCDSSKSSDPYFNCLYAGAQTSYRDIGISSYGTDGNIKKEDYQKLLAAATESDQKIAALEPLNERVFSIDSHSSFARTVLMNAVVPLQTSGSFVDFQASLVDMIGKLPSVFGSTLSSNTSAAIDEDTNINNLNPAGFRVESLKNTPISATLNESDGSTDSCPQVEGENMCKADESVMLAFEAKYDLLPQDIAPGTNAGTDFVLGTYNQKASWGDVFDNAVSLIADKMDVVGTQETAGDKYQAYRHQLKAKNFGVYPDWEGTFPRQCSSGRAIFYNQDKFNFEKGEVFDYPSYDGPGARCGDGESVESGRFNAPIVWLSDKQTGQPIIVMNTHNIAFCCGGGGEKSAVKRYNAAKIYADKVKELNASYPGVPVFLTGDFNESHAVRYDRNTTYERKHENLLFCMLKTQKLMFTVFEPDNPCKDDHESDAGGVDSIYASPGVQVDWKQELPAGHNGPSFSDHPVKFAHLVVPSTEGSGEALRIATFNVLHVGTDPDERQWRTRMPRSIQTLKTNKITVAGLQEVRPEQHHLLTTETYATSTYDIWPKADSGPSFTPNPVIWDKSLFSLVDGKTLQIEYDNGSKVDHAVLVKLKDLKDPGGHEFYVLNTHDPANARPGSDQANALSRLHNTQFYVRFLADLSKEGKPIFLTGDFNAGYNLSGNQNPYNNDADNLAYCVISRGGVMKNVWDIFQNKQFHCPRDSTPGGDPIDHIYVTGVDGVSRVWTVNNEFGQNAGGNNGSDHPTVMAAVKLPWGQSDDGGDTSANGIAWPLAKRFFDNDRADWLGPHTGTSSSGGYSGTAWGEDNMGTHDKGAGIASDIGDPPVGTPVYAMLDGVVTSTNLCGEGDGVAIKSVVNGKTLGIAYMHGINQRVHRGDRVKAGQQIMTLNQRGCTVHGAHVHIGIAYDGKYLCPQDVFLAMDKKQTVNWVTLTGKANVTCSGR